MNKKLLYNLKYFIRPICSILFTVLIVRFFFWFLIYNSPSESILWQDALNKAFSRFGTLSDDLNLYIILSASLSTMIIAVLSWAFCSLFSFSIAYIKSSYSRLDRLFNSVLSLCNIHLFGGYIILDAYILKGSLSGYTGWIISVLLVVFCNGILQELSNTFFEKINYLKNKKYVLFAASQGISTWIAYRKEMFITFLDISFERFQFFMFSSIIIEMAFQDIKGLGLLLLNYIRYIQNGKDMLDQVTILVLIILLINKILEYSGLIFKSYNDTKYQILKNE